MLLYITQSARFAGEPKVRYSLLSGPNSIWRELWSSCVGNGEEMCTGALRPCNRHSLGFTMHSLWHLRAALAIKPSSELATASKILFNIALIRIWISKFSKTCVCRGKGGQCIRVAECIFYWIIGHHHGVTMQILTVQLFKAAESAWSYLDTFVTCRNTLGIWYR